MPPVDIVECAGNRPLTGRLDRGPGLSPWAAGPLSSPELPGYGLRPGPTDPGRLSNQEPGNVSRMRASVTIPKLSALPSRQPASDFWPIGVYGYPDAV